MIGMVPVKTLMKIPFGASSDGKLHNQSQMNPMMETRVWPPAQLLAGVACNSQAIFEPRHQTSVNNAKDTYLITVLRK